MSEIKHTRLGDILGTGRALISGPFGSNISSRFFMESGVPVIRGNNLTSGMEKFVDDGFAYLSVEKADELRSDAVRDDIIFTAAGTIGQVGIIPPDARFDRYVISNKQIRARLNTEVVDPLFAFYWFSAPESVRNIQAHNTGSTIPLINLSVVRGLEISLPTLEAQKAIVEVLASLDDKIELNRRMNETLEAMAQAIFRDWFVDFGPVRRKLAGAADPVEIMGGLTSNPARAAELAGLFPDALGEGGLPAGWSEPPLSEHLEIIGGGTPKTSNPAYWEGDIPWFSVGDTPAGSDVFVFDTEKRISPAGLAGSSARLIPAGTTIISARGTIGNLAIAAQDMTFNQSCYALRSARGDHPYFVYLLATYAVDQLRSMAHGSVFSTITRQTFDAMSFASPHVAVLDAIDGLLSPLFQRIKAAVAENRTLAETRDYLLPRLMSGEVRVREIAA